jgi:hypothetical protein
MSNLKGIIAGACLIGAGIFPVAAQKASIDYRFNTVKDDAKNYVTWSADGKTYKDSFDAKTGASKAQSTKNFNAVRFDTTGKAKATPAGLRSLILYPVASRATAEGDAFTVSEEGQKIVISFVHRGTAYRITTDAAGTIDMAKSFETAAGLADNIAGTFTVKADYLKSGGNNTKMSDIDWSKVTFSPDIADAAAAYKYSGTLKAEYGKDGILTIKGSLSK